MPLIILKMIEILRLRLCALLREVFTIRGAKQRATPSRRMTRGAKLFETPHPSTLLTPSPPFKRGEGLIMMFNIDIVT